MFSRLLKSAKSYIAPRKENLTLSKGETSLEQIMVTPRAQRAADKELAGENSINLSVPTSSAKSRKRIAKDEGMSDDDVFVTPSSKKRKVLPVRAKNTKSPKRAGATRPVVEIPVSQATPELDFVEGEELEELEEEEEEVETNAEQSKLLDTAPSKHHRFASEEPAQDLLSNAKEELSPVKKKYHDVVVISSSDEDEEDSDDDEAPEAIGIQEAAKAVKSKQNKAAQAVKRQLTATRTKRKERDDNLKRQSEDKRRKIVTEEGPGSDFDIEQDGRAETVKIAVGSDAKLTKTDEPTHHKKHTGLDLLRGELPEYLPGEYLEDIEPTALVVPEDLPSKKSAKSRKTKLHNLVEKAPRDKRIGSTTYRVTKIRSTNLAPKSAYQARSIKESWLQGRSGKANSAERKPFSKSFFKNRQMTKRG